MTDREWLDTYIIPYGEIVNLRNDDGCIAWRLGTGGNAELLHLRSAEPRSGCGYRLLKTMLAALREKPPYATVFGFTRAVNQAAQAFYKDMGFDLTLVKGVYADGAAVIFSAEYKLLCARFGIALSASSEEPASSAAISPTT